MYVCMCVYVCVCVYMYVCVGDRPIDGLQFSSMVSVGLNEPIHKHSKLNWNHRVIIYSQPRNHLLTA